MGKKDPSAAERGGERWLSTVIPLPPDSGGQRGTGEGFSSGELMCRAGTGGQVEAPSSDAVCVEMRTNEVNTTLHTGVVIKGAGVINFSQNSKSEAATGDRGAELRCRRAQCPNKSATSHHNQGLKPLLSIHSVCFSSAGIQLPCRSFKLNMKTPAKRSHWNFCSAISQSRMSKPRRKHTRAVVVILLLLLYTAVTSLVATFTLQRCFSHNSMMQAAATGPFIDDIQVGKFSDSKWG